MFKYLVLCALISHSIWAKPVHQLGELASHLVIVTPQAQVHLEPLAKYAGSTFIHHLSPLARIAAPHDETIVYVPASAAAPVIPIEALASAAHQVGRSSSGELQLTPIAPATQKLKQNDQIQSIQQAFEQAQAAASNAQTAAQEGFGQIGEQFAEAAASFSPGSFFPSPGGSGSNSGSALQKDEKLKERIETPANTQPLLAASGRQFIAIAAPGLPHIVDFVHGAPVLVSHISAIRARSLEDASQVPVVAVPALTLGKGEGEKPANLPSKTFLQRDDEQFLKREEEPLRKDSAIPADRDKAAVDVGRFLEANALKDDLKPEKLSSLLSEQKQQQPDQQQVASLSLNKIAESQSDLEQQPLGKTIADVNALAAPKVVDPVPVEEFVVA